MASELERLLLSFEADTRKLRDALAGAESGVDKFERGTNRSLGKTENRFAAFEARATGALKAVAATLAAQLGAGKAWDAISDVDALQKTATAAGITAQKLQELRAAARSAGMANGELDGVMTKFAVTMGEFRGRSGEFYDFLRRELPTVEAQLRATKSQDEAFNVVAETVRRLTNAEDRALVTKKALGEASIQLVTALQNGKKGLEKSADEARQYGQVLSEDAVRATVDLKKEIDLLGNSLSVAFQERLGKAAPAITSFLQSVRDLATKSKESYQKTMERLSVPVGPAKPAAIAAGKELGDFFANAFDEAVIDGLKREKIGAWTTELDFQVSDQLNDLARRHGAIVGDSVDIVQIEYERELDVFRKLLAEKKITEAEFNKAREQVSVATGARIAEAYEKETAVLREQFASISATIDNTVMRGLDDMMRTGKTNFRELISDMMIQLTKLAIQAEIVKPILDSVFRPGSSFGSLFGGSTGSTGGGGEILGTLASLIPGRAAGGPVSAGKPYIVGEKRPELFVPNTSGRIMPRLPGMGGSNLFNIDARGADIGVEQRLRAMFAQLQKSQGILFEGLARSSRRFPMRSGAA